MAEKPGVSKKDLLRLGRQVDYKSQKLSLRQRMQIVLRKDAAGRARHGLFRTAAAVLVVLALVIAGGKLQPGYWDLDAPVPVPVRENEVQLSFVGDVMLGRYVASYGEKESYTSLFKDSRILWENSSLVFANLECAVIKQAASYYDTEKNIKLPASRTALHMAANSGINAVSMANNHAGDYGRKGVRHMIESLEEYGIAYAGAGANRTEAGAYRLLEADGLTVGFVACTEVLPDHFAATKDGYGVCSTGYASLYENVLDANTYSDFVVVYVHWGNENSLTVTQSQREIAHQLIDSGADVVIGSHPHILQETEQYKGGIVFYSLGNFIFDQAARQCRNSVMVQLNVDKTTGEGYFTLVPMRINNFHPYETVNRFYVSEIQRSLLKTLPADAYTVLENGRIRIPMQVFRPGEKMQPPADGTEPAEERTPNE